MSKKIIAVALAILTIAVLFTGCSRYGKKVEINGKEYIMVTDDEGNTVLNEEGNFLAVVTDEDGKVIMNDDGEEPQTYVIQMSDHMTDDYIQGKNYKITAPKGWTPDLLNRVAKDGTDDKCYVQYAKVSDLGEQTNTDGEKVNVTFKSYVETINTQNAAIILAFEQEGYKVETKSNKETLVLEDVEIPCEVQVFKIFDSNNKVVHYAEAYYFETETEIYKIGYACENGVGYDETFSFKQFLLENFTYSGKVE